MLLCSLYSWHVKSGSDRYHGSSKKCRPAIFFKLHVALRGSCYCKDKEVFPSRICIHPLLHSSKLVRIGKSHEDKVFARCFQKSNIRVSGPLFQVSRQSQLFLITYVGPLGLLWSVLLKDHKQLSRRLCLKYIKQKIKHYQTVEWTSHHRGSQSMWQQRQSSNLFSKGFALYKEQKVT